MVVGAKYVGCFFDADLFSLCNYLFQLWQGSAKASRQTVRQQTEGCMAVGAIPPGDLGALRGARVRAVPCEPAVLIQVQWAARQTCTLPPLRGNVLLAGKTGGVPQLHLHNGPYGSNRAGHFPV